MKAGSAGVLAVLAMAVWSVGRLQPGLAKTVHSVQERDDVYVLPPPAQLRAATLGWQAAAVDLLWSDLLVQYGTHFGEHRDFTNIPKYVDAILELEPDYAPVYRYVSTMLAYRPMQGTEADVRQARAYLERGTRERPDDAKLWLEYGQFIAFIGPGFLKDEKEGEAWHRTGAEAIGRSVELGEDADRALSAASLLTRAGANDEAIRFLEHAYEMTQSEEIGRKLAALQGKAFVEAADGAARKISERWRQEMPFAPRDRYLLLGPAADPSLCAGVTSATTARCARDWREADPQAGL
jgi:tetratricopeptide (TPR) repeat protein